MMSTQPERISEMVPSKSNRTTRASRADVPGREVFNHPPYYLRRTSGRGVPISLRTPRLAIPYPRCKNWHERSVSMGEARQEEGNRMAANAIAPGIPGNLEEIFQAHHARVFRAAYRITGNPSDAEDVLQTVFLRLMRQDWSAERVSSIESYLHRAAVNAALDVVRARQDARKVALDDIAPVLRGDTRLQPDRRQAAGELRSILRGALARLSPKAAEMFALRYFEGYGNSEIAGMLGATAPTSQ